MRLRACSTYLGALALLLVSGESVAAQSASEIVDAMLAAFVSLALKARRGEIEREQAIHLISRSHARLFAVLDRKASGDQVSED